MSQIWHGWVGSAGQKIKKLSESPTTVPIVAKLCFINCKSRKITKRFVQPVTPGGYPKMPFYNVKMNYGNSYRWFWQLFDFLSRTIGAPLDLDPGGHLCWLPDTKTMMNMPKKEQQKYLWKILWLMYKNPPSMVGCCGCCEGKSLLLFPAPTNCHKIVESGVEQDGENIISSISHSVDWNLGEKV